MKTEHSEYDNYRWVNCNRWSEAKEVKALVTHLVQGISSRKNHGYRINMKALVLDLYHSYLCDPEQYLAYSRDKADYTGTGRDHSYIKNHNVTYDYMIGCIDHLVANKWLENRPGGQFYDEESKTFHSYVSRMKPTKSLAAIVAKNKLTPDMISTFVEDEVLILRAEPVEIEYEYKGKVKKGEVKPPLKVPNNTETRRMAKKVRQYNALLDRTQVDVDIECLTEKDRDELVEQLADMDLPGVKRIVLRLSKKFIYRVFNNGSMEEGGRYYGGWWVSAPSIVRKYITINGEPTVELDFSAMHIHLLYAVKGVNYARLKEDAYTLNQGPHSLENKNDDRDLNKLILLTAFNAKTPEKAISAVFDELRKGHKLGRYKIFNHGPLKAKLELLKKKHPLISSLIANDFGRKLQYYDSCVMERVIDYFTSRKIAVLTVHDSVICQPKYHKHVTDMMLKCYYDAVNQLLNLRVSPVPEYYYAWSVIKQLVTECTYKAPHDWIKHKKLQSITVGTKFKPTINDIVPDTLNVKTTKRSNICKLQCKWSVRKSNKIKFMPNIKIEIVELTESYRNALVIK